MKMPSFFDRSLSMGPERPSNPARDRARHGCIIGCFVALCFWFAPIPVVFIVRWFDIQGPFGDIMLMTIPVVLALPVIGAGIAVMVGHSR